MGCCCESQCCTGRCFPGAGVIPGDCPGLPSDNPQPTTLTVEMSTDSPYGCFSGSTTVTLVAQARWALGVINATCSWHNPVDSTAPFVTWNLCVLIAIQCAANSDTWGIEFRPCASTTYPAPAFLPEDGSLTKASCDPILLSGTICWKPAMLSVVFPAVPPQPPLLHPTICLSFLVYETP